MKTTFVLSILLVVATAREVSQAAPVQKRHYRTLGRREVPQEQSHKKYLTACQEALQLDNPAGIVDPVFGLLGAAAAAEGAGTIKDTDCLQQATADQAFTNAKAAGNVDLMVAALVYRALERNTLSVGEASKPCTSLQAVNPEIAALQQHQDPASANAAAVNKEITLELARQIASIGGDPLLALESGTFKPGQIGDPTAAGNTCNDPDDAQGCIFTQNLLVEDATAEEIAKAVAGIQVGAGEGQEEVVKDPTATTTEEVATTTELATTTTAADEVATTTTDLATTTTAADEVATTTADAVVTECPAAVTVTVTVTAAEATRTIVVNAGNGKGNGNNKNALQDLLDKLTGNNGKAGKGPGRANNGKGNGNGNGNGNVKIVQLGRGH